MRGLRAWLFRLLGMFDRERRERELSEELASHLQMHIEDRIRAGMDPAAARRDALIRLGGVEVTKERYRERRGIPWLEIMRQDVIYGLRTMRRNPGFAAAAVLTLGLGIGATTAIFTVVYAVLLRPLPYPQPDRLVYIKENLVTGINFFAGNREFATWQRRSKSLSTLAAYMSGEATLTGVGAAERVTTGSVTASFFPLLGAQPVLGRNFLPEEDRPGGVRVAILSHAFWQRRFAGDRSALGKVLALDGQGYTVVGVLPASFLVPDRYAFLRGHDYDVWTPFALDPSGAGFQLVRAVGRLAPGVSREAAQAELDALLQPLVRKGRTKHVVLADWQEEIAGGVKRSLLFFLAAAGFVLLIACVNVANLLLSRASAREKEMAVRHALGAGRSRLVRQLLTESGLLALSGGIAGLALAFWGKDLLVAFISRNLPVVEPIRVDYRVLGFTLALALLTGLVFGLAPALESAGVRWHEALKGAGRGAAGGRSRHGLRDLLVVVEVALAMVVLVGAGLLIKSFLLLRGINAGFQADRVLTLRVNLTESKYPTAREQSLFFQQVLERLQGLRGVQAAGATGNLPLGGNRADGAVTIEGRPESGSDIASATVTPGYFLTLGIPLLAGRGFTDFDREGAPGVALVNQSFVRRYFPNEDCLGKRVKSWFTKNQWMSIAGVVGDVREDLKKEPPPEIYLSYLQAGRSSMYLVARAAGDAKSLSAGIRAQMAAIDRDQPPDDVMTMEERRAEDLAPRRVDMLLLGSLAALGLVLGAIGIYGVVSYSASRRTHEIGIRVALGAGRADVLSLVLGQGLWLVLIGETVGLAGALALNRVVASMVFRITTTDPVTYAGVAAIWAAVGIVACYLPARRAMRVDPLAALRSE
ncbi:MAG: ABC transporter permease [Acidobacteriia bacterium]|nr:ABC transporter permease [Terriglobia bacterium]